MNVKVVKNGSYILRRVDRFLWTINIRFSFCGIRRKRTHHAGLNTIRHTGRIMETTIHCWLQRVFDVLIPCTMALEPSLCNHIDASKIHSNQSSVKKMFFWPNVWKQDSEEDFINSIGWSCASPSCAVQYYWRRNKCMIGRDRHILLVRRAIMPTQQLRDNHIHERYLQVMWPTLCLSVVTASSQEQRAEHLQWVL